MNEDLLHRTRPEVAGFAKATEPLALTVATVAASPRVEA
jgi:hypothetical protein